MIADSRKVKILSILFIVSLSWFRSGDNDHAGAVLLSLNSKAPKTKEIGGSPSPHITVFSENDQHFNSARVELACAPG